MSGNRRTRSGATDPDATVAFGIVGSGAPPQAPPAVPQYPPPLAPPPAPSAATERPPSGSASPTGVFVPLLAGAAVAVGLGVFAKVHEPQFFSVNVAGFSSPTSVKSWLATLAAALAVTQLVTAAAMYGKLSLPVPGRMLGRAHVWSGRLAVLVSVPVAVHCLYALGYSDTDTRVLAHSLLGCFVYGAFVSKMLLLTRKSLPTWVIPTAGGIVLAAFVGVWFTSALWFFQTSGLVI